MILSNADTFIFDLDYHLSVFFVIRSGYHNPFLRVRQRMAGILDQINQDLFYPLEIAPDSWQVVGISNFQLFSGFFQQVGKNRQS